MKFNVRYGIFSLAVAAAIGYVAHDFLLALSWSALLAIALFPLHKILRERLHMPAWLSVVVISAGIMSLVIVPLSMIAIKAVTELPGAKILFWTLQEHGLSLPASLTSHSSLWSHVSPELQKLGLISEQEPTKISVPDNLTARLTPILKNNHDSLLHMTLMAGRHTTHIIEQTLFTFIGFVTFLAGGERLTQQIINLSTNIIGEGGPEHVRQMGRAIKGTVTGIVLIGILQGLAISIALLIGHCPHPAIFTSLIIAAGLIPFCAPIALFAAAGATFFSAGLTSTIIVAAWGMAVIFLADHVVKPKLVGHSTRLGFLSSMIAIIGGLKTMGLIGIFIGPALFSVGLTLWEEFAERQQNKAINP